MERFLETNMIIATPLNLSVSRYVGVLRTTFFSLKQASCPIMQTSPKNETLFSLVEQVEVTKLKVMTLFHK